MLRHMPSPRGTNHERLYILQARKPGLALDARPRRMARDGDYRDASEMIEGGIDTIAQFCAENLADKEIEALIDALNVELHRRRVDTITGAVDRASHPWLRHERPVSPKAARKAEADLSDILGGLAPNKVL